jgi:hypothetical protein
MTISDSPSARVRLRFVVVLMLVLPVLALAIWDYVEARRLNARMDAIVASGAPTSNQRYHALSGGAADADRYYRAAAALIGTFRPPASPGMDYRVGAAVRSGDWTPNLIDEVRAQLAEHREALSLVDRAAALPFEGFAPGWSFGFLTSGLIRLARLCDLRAIERAVAGEPDAAFDSLYAELQLSRTIGQAPRMSGLATIVARAKPSAAARARVAQALADFDRDDRMVEDFTRARAVLLDASRRDVDQMPWIARPLVAHRLTRQLDTFAALVAGAQRPPAERHAAVIAVGLWPTPFAWPADLSRQQLEIQVKGTERDAATIRCARRLVAGEVVDCQP